VETIVAELAKTLPLVGVIVWLLVGRLKVIDQMQRDLIAGGKEAAANEAALKASIDALTTAISGLDRRVEENTNVVRALKQSYDHETNPGVHREKP